MRKDNSIYNKKQPGLYIYLYLQSQIPTSCYSGKKTIRHFHGKISPYFRFSKKNIFSLQLYKYNPQIQISAESETKRSIFREKDKTKRSKKESAQHSKSRNKSFVMTSVSAL